MREIDFGGLPRKISDERSNGKQIDWIKSVGFKMKFTYDDIEGVIEILKYENKAVYIYIEGYTPIEGYRILTSHLLKIKIKGALKMKTAEYRFNVGELVQTNKSNFLISKHIKMRKYGVKGYLCECQDCKEELEIDEYQLLRKDTVCYICSDCVKEVRAGVNDVATTRPDLVKFFKNRSDATKVTLGSSSLVEVKCPDCEHASKVVMNKLSSYGFNCSKCGDKKSFGSKFIFNILCQSGLEFEQEKMFEWSNNDVVGKRLYDFCIPSLSMVIEVHGLQHYKHTNRGRTLKEEQENDRLKKELALTNGIKHYIVIDARYSTLKWLEKSVRNSELMDYDEFNNINCIECAEFSSNSLVKIASDLWNNNMAYTTADIGKVLKLTPQTISRYLKLGSELGFCDYTVEKGRIRSKFKYKGESHPCYNKKGIEAYGSSPCKVIYPNGDTYFYDTAKECQKVIPESVYKKCIKGNIYKSKVKKLDKYNGIKIEKIEKGVA